MISPVTLTTFALLLSSCQAIWPAPQHLTTGNTTLFISQCLTVTLNGDEISTTIPPDFSSPLPDSSQIVQAGVVRAMHAIFQHNFVPWKLRPRDSDFEPPTSNASVSSLAITLKNTTAYAIIDADESYALTLSAEGAMAINANTAVGVLRALDTTVQLFYKHSCGELWYTSAAPVAITDFPTYSHRGVLLDVARNWYPPHVIKHLINAMSWNKLNRLHIHMTDSQSWPLEVPALPDLAAKGAYSPAATYSPNDFSDLQLYALERGITVITEIDMPGHIGSVANAYPDLIVGYNDLPYYYWCAEPPCGAFKLNDTGPVYEFLDALFSDVLPRITPYSPYFHTGGDELNANSSHLDPTVGSDDPAVIGPLLQAFIDKVHDRVLQSGLAPIVWEEILLQWNITIDKSVVVQTWLGQNSVGNATARGHQVIDSNYNFWYLDCGRGQWLNFDNGPAYTEFYPFSDYCGPAKPWQLVYSHDPAAGLPAAQAALVLGGEVAVWGETIDPSNLDSLVWPRAAAAAEVLWSGRVDPSTGANRSLTEAARRLADMRERMVARGVSSSPVQMIYCTQEPSEYCSFPVPATAVVLAPSVKAKRSSSAGPIQAQI